MPAKESFPFTIQLAAGNSIDQSAGTLVGVVVAEVGVATGHYAYADAGNKVLGVGGIEDAAKFRTATKQLPLCMDETSLASVVKAGKLAKRVKAREDHDDAIGSRAGFVDNFRIENGKAICDATIFDSYRNRGVFMETAAETPELIGLSGDFRFVAEIIGDAAYMRVSKIEAVDIVDKGALTHAGLFRALVDTSTNANRPSSDSQLILETNMASKTQPDGDALPDLEQFKTLCAAIAAYRAKHAENASAIDEAMSAINPVNVPTPKGAPAPVTGKPGDPEASVKDPSANFAALEEKLTATFGAKLTEAVNSLTTASQTQMLEMRKQMSALGIKATAPVEPTAEEVAAAKKKVDDEQAAKLAAGKPAGDFLTLKASVAKERKVKPAEAARLVISEHPEVFDAYLKAKGIIKAA